jgi:DNA-binding MarR family transcriptional regulator
MKNNIFETNELTDNRICGKLIFAGFAVSRVRKLETAKLGLTLEQSAMLHFIIDHGGTMTIKEIINETMHQPNSVYSLLNKMVKMGILSNTRGEENGDTSVSITKKGKSLFDKITTISAEEVFSVLPVKDKVILMKILLGLINQSRYLLGIDNVAPITKLLNHGVPEKPKPTYFFNGDGSPSGITLCSALFGASFAISRLRELELAKFGLTVQQLSILRIIFEHGGTRTVKEITDETLHQANSVYIILNRIEKMGFIHKTRKEDSGSTAISITADGKKLLKKITTISLELTISQLKATEKVKLASCLDMIVDKARDLLGIPFTVPIMHYLSAANQNKHKDLKTLSGGR